MSTARQQTFPCPRCRSAIQVELVIIANGARNPHVKAAILNDEIQTVVCENCDLETRIEPTLSYFDTDRNTWVAAYPMKDVVRWREYEKQSLRTFDSRSAATAPPLKPRVTFGWHGLKEKILAIENGIDDVDLELAKAAIMRGASQDLLNTSALRLVSIHSGDLLFDWFDLDTQVSRGLIVTVEANMFSLIKREPEAWARLRAEIDRGLFVDMLKFVFA